MQFFHLGQLPKLIFFIPLSPNLTIQRYVKHDSARIHVFFTFFAIGCGGAGGQTGLVHNLRMQFFSLYSSKIEVSETYVFAIVIT